MLYMEHQSLSSRRLHVWSKWQPQSKHTALAQLGTHFHRAAMLQSDCPHNEQPQSLAAPVRTVGKAPIKHMREIFRSNAVTGVLYGNDGLPAFLLKRQGDSPFFRCKGKGVVAKVLQR